MQACLLDVYLADQTILTLKSIACTFGDVLGDSDALNECVNQIFGDVIADPMSPIDSCVKGVHAEELMTENANYVAALTPKISHVPW